MRTLNWLHWAEMLDERPLEDHDLQSVAQAIRRLSLQMIYHAASGHPGGALSAADLLSYLYFKELRIDPTDPAWPERDRFIMSKGHSCPALYAALGLRGCFGPDPVTAWRTFRKINGVLQGHPHVLDTPWAETSTGSLGQGFSVAVGLALGLRHLQHPARVYVMLGDGEQQEGEVWEAMMCAAHYRLNNLCAVIDYNKMQSDALNEEIMSIHSLRDRWQAFHWQVVEIDGHNFSEMEAAFAVARATRREPTCIIGHTIKGKGVSFMEGSPAWHGSVKLREDEWLQALRDLRATEEEMEEYKRWD